MRAWLLLKRSYFSIWDQCQNIFNKEHKGWTWWQSAELNNCARPTITSSESDIYLFVEAVSREQLVAASTSRSLQAYGIINCLQFHYQEYFQWLATLWIKLTPAVVQWKASSLVRIYERWIQCSVVIVVTNSSVWHSNKESEQINPFLHSHWVHAVVMRDTILPVLF